ncbi:MAG: hypothetical protein RLZZ422_1888 [Pseudomonadota bacterium]
MGAYAGVALVATLSVPIIYRLSGFTRDDEVDWLEQRTLDEHEALIQKLQTAQQGLKELGIKEGVRQAEVLTDILEDYQSVVETRFVGKQHMPANYLNAARTVQEHAIQNLTDVVAIGHSLSGLSRNLEVSDAVGKQAELFKEQQTRMRGLLDENTKLFNALTETAVEVANIKSISDFDRLDTLARLVSLAHIANQSGQ